MSRPKGSKNKKKIVMDTLGADFELKDKPKRGRPKGSKNKAEISKKTLESMDASVENLKNGIVGEPIKKKRGRPKGSKNGSKTASKLEETSETTLETEASNTSEMEKPEEVLEEGSSSETSESSENKPKKGKKTRKERAGKSIRPIESSGAVLPHETTEFKLVRDNNINHLIMKNADIRVPMESSLYSCFYKDKIIFGYSRLLGEEGKGWFFKYKWFVMDRSFKLLNEFEGKRGAVEPRGKYDGENIDCCTFLQMKLEEIY